MTKMKVRDISRVLEEIAPPSLAESWDNVGLLIGDSAEEVSRLMLCIDLTDAVLAEAKRRKVQMVMAYHSIIFKGLMALRPDGSPAYAAARAGIAVYSMHTALDCCDGGTNDTLAEMLGLIDTAPLEPIETRECKVVTFIPASDLQRVRAAAFAAGAGVIGDYRECSFASWGEGTFLGGATSNPAVGQAGRRETTDELKLEMLCPASRAAAVCAAIAAAHSYETPAVDVIPLTSRPGSLGQGRVGRFKTPTKLTTLISRIKRGLGVAKVLNASAGKPDRLIRRAAVGAGSFGELWQSAKAAGAELLLTGEMKHHDALAARRAGLEVICVGHSNSERITMHRLAERLKPMLPGVKTFVSTADKDPFEIL